MYTLYLLLAVMLLIAFSFIVVPFANNKALKSGGVFILALFMLVFVVGLYTFTGNHFALSEWLAKGEQHYQLQVEVKQLGGIDGIITRIKQKLAVNPNDAQGWFILGKLYLGTHDVVNAKMALAKAHRLQPDNAEINHYNEIALSS